MSTDMELRKIQKCSNQWN